MTTLGVIFLFSAFSIFLGPERAASGKAAAQPVDVDSKQPMRGAGPSGKQDVVTPPPQHDQGATGPVRRLEQGKSMDGSKVIVSAPEGVPVNVEVGQYLGQGTGENEKSKKLRPGVLRRLVPLGFIFLFWTIFMFIFWLLYRRSHRKLVFYKSMVIEAPVTSIGRANIPLRREIEQWIEGLRAANGPLRIVSGPLGFSHDGKGLDSSQYTLLWILEESHIGIHSYENEKAIVIDLVACCGSGQLKSIAKDLYESYCLQFTLNASPGGSWSRSDWRLDKS